MCASNATRARDLVVDFAARGRYHFTSSEFRSALGVSAAAANQALWRLGKRGEVASPGRGFYVIVPPEYRALGCLPSDQFIPALMGERGVRYYVGLLSAAQYHGAAHHRPQVFQVMVGRSRRPIRCGSVGVEFMVRARLADVPLTTFDSPRGSVLASTVEATAVDLVGYMGRAGRGLHALGRLAAPRQRAHRGGSVIPRDYVTAWLGNAPWVEDAQVEQDLVISRALVEMFSHPLLGRSLAFRGGTALYKLYLTPAARYSEDIDLVQVEAGPAEQYRWCSTLRTSTPERDLGKRRAEENEESVTGSFSKTPSKKTGNSDRWNHYIFGSVMATIAIPLTSPGMSSKSLFGETRG